MSTLLIVFLCIDAVLMVALIAFFAVSLVNRKAEPKKEEKLEEKLEEKIEQVKVEEKVVEVVATEEQPQADDNEDDREIIKRIPFAEKMLSLDAKTQEYYDKLNNAFCAMRKINARVSMKGVSYRLGRELVAKLTVRGKTLRLHLALDVNKFEQKVYFQKDLSDVKSYVEVPFAVKVKSDRGLKNALKLLDALMVEKTIEKKARFNQVDSLAELKEKI